MPANSLPAGPVLQAEDVSKTWDASGLPVHAVRPASLAVAAGETVVINGPSGSGKTTLLSILGGLLAPDAGRVRLGDVDLYALAPAARRALRLARIGFVFQRGLLVDYLTVRENVALVARAAARTRPDAEARADELLARLDIAALADRLPGALSAGESQRAALARAVVLRPAVVLADEPTAHLDAAAGAAVAAALREVTAADGAALVVVTHDARLAGIADRRLTLDDGRLGPG